jgi:hypothetical protein
MWRRRSRIGYWIGEWGRRCRSWVRPASGGGAPKSCDGNRIDMRLIVSPSVERQGNLEEPSAVPYHRPMNEAGEGGLSIRSLPARDVRDG